LREIAPAGTQDLKKNKDLLSIEILAEKRKEKTSKQKSYSLNIQRQLERNKNKIKKFFENEENGIRFPAKS